MLSSGCFKVGERVFIMSLSCYLGDNGLRSMGLENLAISFAHLKEFWRLHTLALGTTYLVLDKLKFVTLVDGIYSLKK